MDLIVNFTPTGMIPTKQMTPHVPITVKEIVEDVRSAVSIGITMVHLHARDQNSGQPSSRADIYAELIAQIRSFAPDLVICVSLSGRRVKEFEHRAAPLKLKAELKPDMGSLTLSSLNFNREASINAPHMIQDLAREMKNRKIAPELEAFDAGMINYAKYLLKKELITPPNYFNLILGNIACAQADLLHAAMMIRDLPEKSYWSLAGVGNSQLMMNSVAVAAGGGVRVGLEDNIWFDNERTKLAKNTDLLQRIKQLAEAAGRKIMTPASFRKLINLQPGNGKYGLP
jgi:uncharacterized protein (DUF849 family)